MKISSKAENHIFCAQLLMFLNQVSMRRELRDFVPDAPKPTTCSKSKSSFKVIGISRQELLIAKLKKLTKMENLMKF